MEFTRGTGGILCLTSSNPIFECNDVYDIQMRRYAGDCSNQTGINGNISVDPEFCGVDDSGNYFLQADSPCLPGNHPDGMSCGLIGAFPRNCDLVPTRETSWGQLKSLYQD
jgi:hypothetical protein